MSQPRGSRWPERHVLRGVGRWPMAQVVGTVCGDEASEQDFRLSIREMSRPTKV